ncbi:hypothetical protein LTR08_007022 [Meristemomyces frigidus]|nr:hypothetical protein LTR08_007022 [Meristemomyces frigidus]
MPSRWSNIHATLSQDLPPLIMDRSHPQFLHPTVVEHRILHAIHSLATELTADPKARISTDKTAKKFYVSTEDLRDIWKDYKAEDRVLTPAQEALLCQRLDRLTRYGGKAKAREEPVHAEGLVSAHAIGVLRLLEHMDGRVTYSLRSQWLQSFLDRNPQYRVSENGPAAPEGSTHPGTDADEPWLLPYQKTALYALLEKNYALRSSKGLQEFWKTVKRLAKPQIGYEFFELTAQNEALQKKHRPNPPPGLRNSALGKRKRDAEGGSVVDWRVWDTACNDFMSVDLAIMGKVRTPPCSPPPGMEPTALDRDDEPLEVQYTAPPTPVVPQQSTAYPQSACLPTSHTRDLSWPSHNNHNIQYNTAGPALPLQNAPTTYLPSQNTRSPSYPHPTQPTYSTRSSYTNNPIPNVPTPPTLPQESADIRALNALGALARSPHPNAAATSRFYSLPERLVRESWATRKHRPPTAVARLLAEQERRLHARLRNLECFGGDVVAVESSEGGAEAVVRAYADGVLAEDDQLVEGNMVVHGEWAREFIGAHGRYQGGGGRG